MASDPASSAAPDVSAPLTPAAGSLSLPVVEIRYENVHVRVNKTHAAASLAIPSVAKSFFNIATLPIRLVAGLGRRVLSPSTPPAARSSEFVILDRVSGVIKPGTLTLVISPPGHGKSSFLKMLAGNIANHLFAPDSGHVSFGGVTAATAAEHGVHLGQLSQYVSQLDEHLPHLTVRETLELVHDNAALDPSKYGSPDHPLAKRHAHAVDDVMKLLHLEGCANTFIGSDLARGVSGGEKKRVTVGEGLLTNARCLLLDEPSTGLDSAVTFSIIASLKERAVADGLAVVVALLQPSPEVFSLFDEVVLLREGAVVFHGPRESLRPYLSDLGFAPPEEDVGAAGEALGAGDAPIRTQPSSGYVAAPPTGGTLDLADWLVSFLTSPGAAAVEAAAHNPTGVKPPSTTSALASAWAASPLFAAQMKAPPSAPPLVLAPGWQAAQYGHAYSQSWFTHTGLLIRRQFLLMQRNPLYLKARLMSSIILSFVLGGLYFNRSIYEGFIFYGLLLNACMNVGKLEWGEEEVGEVGTREDNRASAPLSSPLLPSPLFSVWEPG